MSHKEDVEDLLEWLEHDMRRDGYIIPRIKLDLKRIVSREGGKNTWGYKAGKFFYDATHGSKVVFVKGRTPYTRR